MEKTKFEEACEKIGIPAEELNVSNIPEQFREYMANHYKLIVRIQAKNNGRRVDLTDSSYLKYAPWMWFKKDMGAPSGFVLTDSNYDYSDANSVVGSRLQFFSEKDALEAIEELKEEYIINQLK